MSELQSNENLSSYSTNKSHLDTKAYHKYWYEMLRVGVSSDEFLIVYILIINFVNGR